MAGQPKTLQRVRTYWIPELRRLNVRVPIILVGCKNDIKPPEERAALQDVRPRAASWPSFLDVSGGAKVLPGCGRVCEHASCTVLDSIEISCRFMVIQSHAIFA